MKNKILCPIINEYIEKDECFDVHMTLEGAPKRTAPEQIVKVKNYKDICIKCMHHREDW